eukprot:TRINITY_DN2118_c2_g1_i3.p1 TRINITY_DN2118_c2_g1~~TRINITY_DN2118_c2_g1_i3.p1  ORF type:complete len:233 (+),score=68.63 TRINITY_DN2118_c2_g1_i3:282-980(+)
MSDLWSLQQEGFDMSFLKYLPPPSAVPQPKPSNPKAPLGLAPSEDIIQVMLNKNADLLLHLQLSQYERTTPVLTEKESRLAVQLCESLTALTTKTSPKDLTAPMPTTTTATTTTPKVTPQQPRTALQTPPQTQLHIHPHTSQPHTTQPHTAQLQPRTTPPVLKAVPSAAAYAMQPKINRSGIPALPVIFPNTTPVGVPSAVLPIPHQNNAHYNTHHSNTLRSNTQVAYAHTL